MANKKHQIIVSELYPTLAFLVKKLRKLYPVEGLLSQGERAVLVLLKQHESLLPSQLASMEKITPQSMGQILKQLSILGFINKKVSATDKRKINISLSPKGKEMIQHVKNEREEWLTKAMETVCSKEEIALLKAVTIPLSKIVEFE